MNSFDIDLTMNELFVCKIIKEMEKDKREMEKDKREMEKEMKKDINR
jgi:hypothetical protein